MRSLEPQPRAPASIDKAGLPPENRTDLRADGQKLPRYTAFPAPTRWVPCLGGHLAARPAHPVDAGGSRYPHVSTS